ncbi:MAG: hypothetical protein QNJ41_13605 [Xenococcaceae cyanobacterium MO_188.B32]|nr:hypothetical protein [Xenococcaceae cyanobacterium MO_188.B32]
MYDRLNKRILAHQGHSEQKLEIKESPKTQSTESIVEEQNPQQPSLDTNTTVEIQSEPVTKITNSSPVNAVTIAGEVILFSLIITPFLLTWIKSRVR